MNKVAIIMGSDSDFEVVKKAIDILEEFGVESEVRIMSAHRTPNQAHDFAKGAVDNGFDVIIAAAGKAAHLAGVIASMTTLPVIGIPIKTSLMGGMDSMLSTVQMPKGIPVATVAVDGAENAGLLAVQIMGIKYPELAKKLADYKTKMEEEVIAKDEKLQKHLSE